MTVVRIERRTTLHYNSVSISFQNWNEEIMWKGQEKKLRVFYAHKKYPPGSTVLFGEKV
jgi:hypothetical protein